MFHRPMYNKIMYHLYFIKKLKDHVKFKVDLKLIVYIIFVQKLFKKYQYSITIVHFLNVVDTWSFSECQFGD